MARSTTPRSDLALLIFDSAAAPRHGVFDAKYLDPEVMRLVLRDWVGGDDRSGTSDPTIADRTAVSLALVDARFFTSLYHHYCVQQEPNIIVLYRAFGRRLACRALHRTDRQQDDVDDSSTSWFLPRFRCVAGTSVQWRNESIERATWLLDRIIVKKLLFRPGEIVRAPLPITSLRVHVPSAVRAPVRVRARVHVNIKDPEFGEMRSSQLASSLEHLPNLSSFHALRCVFAKDAFSLIASSLANLALLTSIQLDGTHITTAAWTALANSLVHLPSLTKLSLSSTSLRSTSCRQLAVTLSSTSNLTSLDLSRNSIGTDGFRALVSQLRHVTSLITLTLDWCHIDDDDMCWFEFASALEYLQRLTTLRIADNALRDESAFALANALCRLPEIARIDCTEVLRGNDVTSLKCRSSNVLETCVDIATLPRVPRLRSLDLSDVPLTVPVTQVLAAGLRHLPLLTELNLARTGLDAASFRLLAESLHHTPLLTSLNLEGCEIGPEGLRALASVLPHLSRVTSLSPCRIKDDGSCWTTFAESLHHVQELRTLAIADNLFYSESVFALADALCRLPEIKHIDATSMLELRGGAVTSLDCQPMSTLDAWFHLARLPHLPRLQSLNLSNACLTAHVIRELTASLRLLPLLTELNLAQTNVLAPEFCSLAESLQHTPLLTSLDLEECDVDAKCVRTLASVFPQLPRLTVLKLRACKIEDDGNCWITFAVALRHLQELAEVTIADNPINQTSALSIVDALGSLPQLKLVDSFASVRVADATAIEWLAPTPHSTPLMATLLQRASHLRMLTIANAPWLGAADLQALVEPLRCMPQLTALSLRGNPIGGQGLRALAPTFVHLTRLSSLSLDGCGVNDSDAFAAFASSLHHLQHLQSLGMTGNTISPGCARLLADAVIRLPQLAHVNSIPRSEYSDASVRSICLRSPIGAFLAIASLQCVPQLTTLDLYLADSTLVQDLASALHHVPQLCSLVLRSSLDCAAIGDGHGRALAASLRQLAHLTQLDVCNLKIKPRSAAARALGAAVQNDLPQLTRVNGVAAASVIGATSVDLTNVDMGPVGAYFLASQLRYAPQLMRLVLRGCAILQVGCEAIVESLQHVPNLTKLDLSMNLVRHTAVLALFAALRHVPMLTSLNLAANGLGKDTFAALGAALEHVPHLIELDLSFNEVAPDAIFEIEQFICSRRTTITFVWHHPSWDESHRDPVESMWLRTMQERRLNDKLVHNAGRGAREVRM